MFAAVEGANRRRADEFRNMMGFALLRLKCPIRVAIIFFFLSLLKSWRWYESFELLGMAYAGARATWILQIRTQDQVGEVRY